MPYDFFVLSLLIWIPGLVILCIRPDLRRLAITLCGFSLPFAFTETLFYPHYWEPSFIANLGERLGFGLEDFLFVTGLAAYTSTAYAVIHKKKLDHRPTNWRLASGLGLVAAGMLGILVALNVPILYTTFLVTGGLTVAMVIRRNDLLAPALLGGLWSTVIYLGVCLAFGEIFPGSFQTTWHTEHYIYRFLWGVPVEELLYGMFCGAAGTVFYPFISGARFRPLHGIILNRRNMHWDGRARASSGKR